MDVTDPDHVDLVENSHAYDQNRSLVKKYFRRDLKVIASLCQNSTDESGYKDVMQKKRTTWKTTQQLVDVETGTRLMPRVIFFLVYNCAFLTISATLMNMYSGSWALTGAISLIIKAASKSLWWIANMLHEDFQAYARILEELRKETKHEAVNECSGGTVANNQ